MKKERMNDIIESEQYLMVQLGLAMFLSLKTDSNVRFDSDETYTDIGKV